MMLLNQVLKSGQAPPKLLEHVEKALDLQKSESLALDAAGAQLAGTCLAQCVKEKKISGEALAAAGSLAKLITLAGRKKLDVAKALATGSYAAALCSAVTSAASALQQSSLSLDASAAPLIELIYALGDAADLTFKEDAPAPSGEGSIKYKPKRIKGRNCIGPIAVPTLVDVLLLFNEFPHDEQPPQLLPLLKAAAEKLADFLYGCPDNCLALAEHPAIEGGSAFNALLSRCGDFTLQLDMAESVYHCLKAAEESPAPKDAGALFMLMPRCAMTSALRAALEGDDEPLTERLLKAVVKYNDLLGADASVISLNAKDVTICGRTGLVAHGNWVNFGRLSLTLTLLLGQPDGIDNPDNSGTKSSQPPAGITCPDVLELPYETLAGAAVSFPTAGVTTLALSLSALPGVLEDEGIGAELSDGEDPLIVLSFETARLAGAARRAPKVAEAMAAAGIRVPAASEADISQPERRRKVSIAVALPMGGAKPPPAADTSHRGMAPVFAQVQRHNRDLAKNHTKAPAPAPAAPALPPEEEETDDDLPPSAAPIEVLPAVDQEKEDAQKEAAPKTAARATDKETKVPAAGKGGGKKAAAATKKKDAGGATKKKGPAASPEPPADARRFLRSANPAAAATVAAMLGAPKDVDPIEDPFTQPMPGQAPPATDDELPDWMQEWAGAGLPQPTQLGKAARSPQGSGYSSSSSEDDDYLLMKKDPKPAALPSKKVAAVDAAAATEENEREASPSPPPQSKPARGAGTTLAAVKPRAAAAQKKKKQSTKKAAPAAAVPTKKAAPAKKAVAKGKGKAAAAAAAAAFVAVAVSEEEAELPPPRRGSGRAAAERAAGKTKARLKSETLSEPAAVEEAPVFDSAVAAAYPEEGLMAMDGGTDDYFEGGSGGGGEFDNGGDGEYDRSPGWLLTQAPEPQSEIQAEEITPEPEAPRAASAAAQLKTTAGASGAPAGGGPKAALTRPRAGHGGADGSGEEGEKQRTPASVKKRKGRLAGMVGSVAAIGGNKGAGKRKNAATAAAAADFAALDEEELLEEEEGNEDDVPLLPLKQQKTAAATLQSVTPAAGTAKQLKKPATDSADPKQAAGKATAVKAAAAGAKPARAKRGGGSTAAAEAAEKLVPLQLEASSSDEEQQQQAAKGPAAASAKRQRQAAAAASEKAAAPPPPKPVPKAPPAKAPAVKPAALPVSPVAVPLPKGWEAYEGPPEEDFRIYLHSDSEDDDDDDAGGNPLGGGGGAARTAGLMALLEQSAGPSAGSDYDDEDEDDEGDGGVAQIQQLIMQTMATKQRKAQRRRTVELKKLEEGAKGHLEAVRAEIEAGVASAETHAAQALAEVETKVERNVDAVRALRAEYESRLGELEEEARALAAEAEAKGQEVARGVGQARAAGKRKLHEAFGGVKKRLEEGRHKMLKATKRANRIPNLASILIPLLAAG